MKGKVVAVTGGFGYLGRIVAETAALRGARVAAIDFSLSQPDGLAVKLGTGSLLLGGVDLSSEEKARSAIEDIVAKLGRLDVLINVAGGFAWQRVEDGEAAQWDRLYAINLKTALNACKAAIPHLLKSGAGRIVNIGAQSAIRAGAALGAYAASKGAVHRLTESLAEELKTQGVTVNAVLPSIIDTPANRADMPGAAYERWVAPTDLASVILFLASDEARAVTGALIPVTGQV